MKKDIKKYYQMEIKDLEKEIYNLRQEIAKLKLTFKVSPPKDTNLIIKKRKQLSKLLTVLKEKQLNLI